MAWVLTGYLLAAAVATPVFGRLGDMFGKRRLFVVSLVFFAAGSAVSALGSSLEVMVAGRVLQGVGGGIFPLAIGSPRRVPEGARPRVDRADLGDPGDRRRGGADTRRRTV